MKAKIHYYDIGDYLSREDKLRIIREFGSVEHILWISYSPMSVEIGLIIGTNGSFLKQIAYICRK